MHKTDAMCTTLFAKKGEVEVTTPRQFKDHFGRLPLCDWELSEEEMDCCLCHCDIKGTLTELGIPFKNDCGDIVID